MARRVTPAVSSPNIWRRPIAATMLRPGRSRDARPTSFRRCVQTSAHQTICLWSRRMPREPANLRSMCARAAVIITAVGPYQLHGPELVAACAATGTAYVDLCGEPAWMRRMIDAHHDEAKRTGARIVFSCGFDSIPFDLGVLTLQEKAREKFGHPARRVKA